MKNCKILWINSYMPCDPGPADAAWDDTDLITCLGQVESLLTSTTYDENVWGKDLNWSMERNTRFARILSSFIARLRLVPVWTHQPVDYTHIHTNYKSTSTLDHFIVTPVWRVWRDAHDATVKLAMLISKSVEVRDSFSFASPPSVLRALQVYCTSYYGSLAGWDLDGPEAKKFYGVWMLNILLSHILPRAAHRYFLPLLHQDLYMHGEK